MCSKNYPEEINKKVWLYSYFWKIKIAHLFMQSYICVLVNLEGGCLGGAVPTWKGLE